MNYGMQPITWGYVDGDYVLAGYIAESDGRWEFRHTAGTIAFSRGIKYTNYNLDILQPREVTASNYPYYFAPALSQMPFAAVFPWMPDAELAALRTFMFSTLPVYDSFTLAEIQKDKTYIVRFADLKMSVRQLRLGFNEVAINLVRV